MDNLSLGKPSIDTYMNSCGMTIHYKAGWLAQRSLVEKAGGRAPQDKTGIKSVALSS